MRVSLLIGLALIAIGMVALYQVKNGFLMSNIAKVYYAPPAEPEALKAAFDDLGDKDAAGSGYLLKQVARARVICTLLNDANAGEVSVAMQTSPMARCSGN